MNEIIKAFVKEQAELLISADSCCPEAKAVAQNWLAALGTDKEQEVSKKLLAELEEDIMPIDQLIDFAQSEAAIEVFGAEMAKEAAAHGKEIKAAGAIYCDCPACNAAAAILEKKAELLTR
ncbi:MAG: molecular chaperone Hsp90 [Peptococcaceae bacterium]|nr:molecular chaperone Hsp90 [Peptococcaceae bacterium]